MPKSFQTSGLVGVDREFDLLWQQVAHVKNSNGASGVVSAPAVVTSVQTVPAQLVVQNTSGSVSVAASTVVVDDSGAGLSVTSSSGGAAKISRAATGTTPTAIAASGSAGSATQAANADHTHAGVASIAVGGGLISKSGSSGAVTLTVEVPVVGADPGSPVAGDLWFNSTTNMLSIYTGSATKRVLMS